MILDELLRETHRVQQELADAAGDDVDQYFQLIHRLALETQQQYGLTFKYGVPAGFVPPVASSLQASPQSISLS